MDLSTYHSLNNFAHDHHAVGDLAIFFASYAVFLVIGGLAILWLLPGRFARRSDRRAIAAAAAATVVGLALVQVINHLYDRTRPFVHHAHHLLINHGKDASFPSDHTTVAFAIAIVLLLYGRRVGWGLALVGLLIAVARVMVGVHYPTDVAGGLVVGAVAAGLLASPMLRGPVGQLNDSVARLYDRTAESVLPLVRPRGSALKSATRPPDRLA